MANKRKLRTRKKVSVQNTEGVSSSSDNEQERAMAIISKLSQKYMNPRKRGNTSADSATDKSSDTAYDGDLESIESSTSSQDTKSSGSLYDFMEEDEEEQAPTQVVEAGKKTGKTSSKSSRRGKVTDSRSKALKKTSSAKGKTKQVQETFVTPPLKGRKRKVLLSPDVEVRIIPREQHKVSTPLVLQEVSNKLAAGQKQAAGQCKAAKQELSAGDKRKFKKDVIVTAARELRSSAKKSKTGNTTTELQKTSVSFMDSTPEMVDRSDSGIFLSPRQTRPRFSSSISETPLLEQKEKSIKPKLPLGKFKAKETSTPTLECMKRGKGKPANWNKVKSRTPAFSPVVRVDTPLSDSLSVFSDDSPRAWTLPEKEPVTPLPAFSLDDDAEVLSLNKSKNKSYKKPVAKKYRKGKYEVEKVAKLVDKMNTEFEELENFELSVEG